MKESWPMCPAHSCDLCVPQAAHWSCKVSLSHCIMPVMWMSQRLPYEPGLGRNNEMLSPKSTDLVKHVEQGLQLLHFFARKPPLLHLPSRFCLSASLHISMVPNKFSFLVWFADGWAGFSLLQHLWAAWRQNGRRNWKSFKSKQY